MDDIKRREAILRKVHQDFMDAEKEGHESKLCELCILLILEEGSTIRNCEDLSIVLSRIPLDIFENTNSPKFLEECYNKICREKTLCNISGKDYFLPETERPRKKTRISSPKKRRKNKKSK